MQNVKVIKRSEVRNESSKLKLNEKDVNSVL